jgi:hypothetical protein
MRSRSCCAATEDGCQEAPQCYLTIAIKQTTREMSQHGHRYRSGEGAHARETTPNWFILERGLGHAKLIILRLGRNWRRGRVVVMWFTVAAVIAFIIVSVVKPLLRGPRGK